MIDGSSSAGFVATLWIERQATALATCPKRLMSAPASSAGRSTRPRPPPTAITIAMPKPSASASASQPVMMNERMPSIR